MVADNHSGHRAFVTAVAGAANLAAQGVYGPFPSAQITSESLTTAAGSTYVLTIAAKAATAQSVCHASVFMGTSTTGDPIVTQVTPSAGQVIVNVKNDHATAALNGTIVVGLQIF